MKSTTHRTPVDRRYRAPAALALTLVLTAIAPASADALVVRDVARTEAAVSGAGCGSEASVVVRLPRRARLVRVLRPRLGSTLRDSTTGALVARITAIQSVLVSGRRAVRFTATGSDDACAQPERYAASGWETSEASFDVLYRRRVRVFMAGTDDRPRIRPRVITIGASERIFGLRWRRFGGRVARGRGVFPANDCVPSCAEGRTTPYPVRVRLSRVRRCDDGRYRYLRLEYRFFRRPPGGGRGGRAGFGYQC